jgi:hypothetical protein
VAGQFDAVHARHADIGQHDIDRMFAQKSSASRPLPASPTTSLAVAWRCRQQRAQAVAGQRLVIDDQDFQRAFWRHGRMMRTS